MTSRAEVLASLVQRHNGIVPFPEFMREALYHPEIGYYTASVRHIGREGDFTTLPARSTALGRAIARWRNTNGVSSRPLIEVGPGGGHLAKALRSSTGLLRRFMSRTHLVEISPRLRECQRQLLGPRAVTWHESIASALQACGGEADILSNELVDAFPCRVLERTQDGWLELNLQIADGYARESWIPSAAPDSCAAALVRPGQRIEVHESFRDWLRTWRPFWRCGRMLTIDYGGTSSEIYDRRPAGTLRAYHHHQRLDGSEVYSGFGHRDITADVNTEDLIRWGEENGMHTVRSVRLPQFLDDYAAPGLDPQHREAAAQFFVVEQSVD